jgi:hypothetical protein
MNRFVCECSVPQRVLKVCFSEHQVQFMWAFDSVRSDMINWMVLTMKIEAASFPKTLVSIYQNLIFALSTALNSNLMHD